MKRWLTGVCFIFLVFAFQVNNISRMHMHPDEELSYRATRYGLDHVFYYQQSGRDNHAPLWFVSFWGWQQIVGDAEVTSRFMSALTTMLTLAITYRLGRRWFGDAAAVGAIAILGANHFFFNYALDIRPYPVAFFAAALSMWMFERWRTKPDTRRTILYGLTIALMLYAHYLLALLVVVQFLFILLMHRNRIRLVGMGAMALGLGVLLWIPWLPTFVGQIATLRNVETASGTARGAAGIAVTTQISSISAALDLAQVATNGLPGLYLLVLLLGLWTLRQKREFWLALFWGIGVSLIAFLVNLFVAVYTPRYISHAIVGLALAIAAVLLVKFTRLRFSGLQPSSS